MMFEEVGRMRAACVSGTCFAYAKSFVLLGVKQHFAGEVLVAAV